MPGRLVDRGVEQAQVIDDAAGRDQALTVARNGWQSRRSGPALAIMRAETLNGEAPQGVRRAANLEDAFVALTGEEIE